ncbi:hypothetical protein GGF42_000589 [Coemansia sp. RSA 2424]|nr:hypothetical protein GGF42_000589 [Coemansia sp. RSA 2424]
MAASASGSDEIRLRSNIDLLHTADQTDNVREVRVFVQGMGQTAGQLLRQLLLAGLGGGVVWPRVECLRIDMRDSGKEMQTSAEGERGPEALRTLNDFLSRALPSLREIEYYGDNAKAVYGCVPIEQLIKERLRGPVPLRVLRVRSDCWPKLTDDYETGITAPPIDIECMAIEGRDESYLMPVPTMVANSLVELTLLPVIEEFEWKLFEPEIDPNIPNPPLVFSSLKSLTLSSAMYIGDELPYRTEDNWYRSVYNRDDWEDEESSDSEDGKLYLNDVEDDLSTRFKNFPNYKPEFPVLSHLELRYPLGMFDVLTFAKSPISSLVLCSSSYSFNEGWDLTIFPGLRSLSFRITGAMSKHDTTRFNDTLSTILPTVSPNLQRLTLAMNLEEGSQLRLSTPPPFADSLSHLTLEGEYGQHDVEHLLQLFPNLRSMSVCAIMGEPVSTVPELVDKHRRANTVQLMMPLNASLRVLNVCERQYFSGYNGWNCIPDPKRPMAPELSHCRGLLIGLVCRLPALDTLRVGSQSVDGVNESIQAIIDSGVGPEHIVRLQRLRVQPLDY